MAKQVRPWLMKPVYGRAPTSARKQMGVSQQNPSGTAAFAPQQSPDVRVQSKPVGHVTRRKRLARLGASMYDIQLARRRTFKPKEADSEPINPPALAATSSELRLSV